MYHIQGLIDRYAEACIQEALEYQELQGLGGGKKFAAIAATRAETRDLLEAAIRAKIEGLVAVKALIDESRGVAGLRLNGDESAWAELRTGGRFEQWLLAFDKALGA